MYLLYSRTKSFPAPFYRCVSPRNTHIHTRTRIHACTYTYTQDTNMDVTTRKPHAPPRLVSSPLNLSCFETNTPLFPSCSRLASSPQLREPIQQLSEQLSSESHRCYSPCQVENVHVRTGYDVSTSRAIIDRSINTYSLQRMPSLSKYNCPIHCRGGSPRNFPEFLSQTLSSSPQYPGYVPASELALIFVILVMHKLHIMIIIVNDT